MVGIELKDTHTFLVVFEGNYQITGATGQQLNKTKQDIYLHRDYIAPKSYDITLVDAALPREGGVACAVVSGNSIC